MTSKQHETTHDGRSLLIAYGSPDNFEALRFFIGAVQAVVSDVEGTAPDEPMLEFQMADDVIVDSSHSERIEVRTGQQLWDWCLSGSPIPGMLVADLSDVQRTDVIGVLDGMVRERAGGNGGPAVLTASLNIGIGTK
jgi:hypothetical protein